MQTYYNLDNFLEGMRKDLDGVFYYEIKNDGVYKIEFSHVGKGVRNSYNLFKL